MFLERINWICSTDTTLLPSDCCSITGVTLYLIPVLLCFVVCVVVVVIVLRCCLLPFPPGSLHAPTCLLTSVPVHVVFHEFQWIGENPFWSALYSLTVVMKLPSTTGPWTGLSDVVSTQLSDSGNNSISPENVKTLNGLTFSTADAYGWSTRRVDVYGSVIISSSFCCTFWDDVLYCRGTCVV